MIQKILFYLFGHSFSPYFTGVQPDPRTTAEKQQDYLHGERVFPTSVNPFGNAQILTSPYPYENQNNTSSCVPHGVGLALAIERMKDVGTYQRLGWLFNYRQRSNFPQEGTSINDAFGNYRHYGAPLYTTVPDVQEEVEANSIVLTTEDYNEAAIFKGNTYYTINNTGDIETISNIASQGHGVAVFLFATYEEYAIQYPKILNPALTSSQAEIRHCVCVLPNSGFTLNGVRYVTIQDSALFGGWHLRHLSEDFVKARVYAAGYWDSVQTLSSGPKPTYHFTQTLKFGATGDEVKALQQLLVSEGLLPTDCVTGAFYGRTLAAIHAFQERYASDILLPQGLQVPTDLWGPACIKKANALLAQQP